MTSDRRTRGPMGGTVSDGPLPVLGVAHYDGPVIIAWDARCAGARHPERGHNVVYHEFAHKLDMLDGVIDGTPPLATPGGSSIVGSRCAPREYEALRNGTDDGFPRRLRRASNPAEFFAVATEAFFDLPLRARSTRSPTCTTCSATSIARTPPTSHAPT